MDTVDDKENQPPMSDNSTSKNVLEELMEQLPQPSVRYKDAKGQLTQILHYGESARSIFLLENATEQRLKLVIALKDAPKSVTKWLALLRCPVSGNPGKYNKLRLLRRALSCVESKDVYDTSEYTELSIMLAKMGDTEANIRQNFLEMRKRRVGERQSLLYEEEAAFEFSVGKKTAAEDVLERGVDNGAITVFEKDELMKKIIVGRAGWVAAFSGSPHEQRMQALRNKRQTLQRIQEKGTEEPLGGSSSLDLTPASQRLNRFGYLTSTPSGTPVNQGRTSAVYSSMSKVSRNSSNSPLLTTPALSTRTNYKSQTTSRKSHRFLLGGPPLRVRPSSCSQSEDEDDDAMMGSQTSPIKTIKPTNTVNDQVRTTKTSPRDKKKIPKVDVGDISYILEWDREKQKKKFSKEGAFKSTSASVTFKTSVDEISPEIKHSDVVPEVKSNIKSTLVEKMQSPKVHKPFPWEIQPNASSEAHPLTSSITPRATGYRRSPKPQDFDPGLDMSSPGSVSSSSSPPVASMNSASSRDALESLTSKVVVNGQKYIKLEQIGSGGSSKVYRMLGPDLKIYALKKIKLKKLDAQSIAQYTNEINLLKKLQGNPHIIKLVAAEQDLQQRQINVIMEHGEIDLSERLRILNGVMDENMLRVIWTQMLKAVNAIHQKRIIHGDLKPANFLFVNGALKLIDFGIAKTISNDTTNIERDSQVGTVNFMSPEAIQGNTTPNGQRNPDGKMKVGRASDIWSLGCILYQIVYSKPPFGDVHNIIEKFRCIIDPAVPIQFQPLQNKHLEDVIRSCLQRDHRLRPTIDGDNGLLNHPFLRGSGNTSSSLATVTLANASQVLAQFGEFLHSQGVASSRINMFMTIGQEGLRANSQLPRYSNTTQERRTDI